MSKLPIDILRSMVGGRIQRVGYKTTAASAAGLNRGNSMLVHDVDQAVIISTGSATMVVEWSMPGFEERLNIVSAPEEGESAAAGPVVDVTNSPAWSARTESPIVGFGVAGQRSATGSELPWALRINLESGSSVVIALGEMRDALPRYQPDNLLVIFDPDLAQSLQVLDADYSAWGRDLWLER